jgi:hypothetical protein
MLFKRKDSKLWWARFTTPNGKRLRVSTGTENRKQAQEFADQLKAKTWNVQKLGEREYLLIDRYAFRMSRIVTK